MKYDYRHPLDLRLLILLTAVRRQETDIEQAMQLISGEILNSYFEGLAAKQNARQKRTSHENRVPQKR